jgi:acetyl-CoA carboxylase carboxyl transferase subunit alpha
LWKHANDETKPRAAGALKLTSDECLKNGVIDAVIPEPVGGAHRAPREMGAALKSYLVRSLRELAPQPTDQLLAGRYDKFRTMGRFVS